MKESRFINKQALKEFKGLPDHIQRQFAVDLHAVCQGKAPFSKFKYLTESVGVGAIKLIGNGRSAYRAIYVESLRSQCISCILSPRRQAGLTEGWRTLQKKCYTDMLSETHK